MADAAPERMAVEWFLQREVGPDARCELIDGRIAARAEQTQARAILAARMSKRIGACVDFNRRGRAFVNMAVRSVWSMYHCYVADVSVTRETVPVRTREVPAPFLVADLVTAHDDRTRLYHYFNVPSMREIVLLHTDCVFIELYQRRDGDTRWFSKLGNRRDWRLKLDTIALDLLLDELYCGLPAEEPRYPTRLRHS